MIENSGFIFELWHIPVIFLAGLMGEFYGAIIGGGSIVMQGVMLYLGLTLQSAIAIDNAAAIGTQVGIIKESKENIKKNWKLIVYMFFPIAIGGVIGTHFLIHINPDIIKNIMIVVISLLLIQLIFFPKRKKSNQEKTSIGTYILLAIFLFILGIYNNFIGVAEGTFSKIALMSLLGFSFIGTMGVKTTAILPIRIYSLVVTMMSGLIFLPYLIVLLVATFIAGVYGVRFAKKIPEKYLKRFLIIVTITYLIYLLIN
ncbi:sulfite exporter TauE/SafE family protein [Candidatus Gracilibacteria bacterium]|nr:sulfite exporter TauE/SafE family protein [Candidatus Gracilibacteria bacterium]